MLARAMASEQASTVSDFIAARCDHDVVVARLVTIIALLGTIPYIALLAVFAILFGARRYELAGRSEGLVYAIGLESLIKVVALALMAGIAVMAVVGAPAAVLMHGFALLAKGFRPEALTSDFPVIMVISAMAIIVLPRQFYMGLVEAQHPDDLVRARFGLAGYLAAMALLVLPIALAGTMLLGKGVEPDLYVLALPTGTWHNWVLGAALVGGFSAASAMAIVDAIALATMVSNDLIFPTIIRNAASTEAGSIGHRHRRFGHHRQVDRDPTAARHALPLEQVGEPAHIGVQIAIADPPLGLGRIVGFPQNRDGVPARR